MEIYICETCGTEHTAGEQPPAHCAICEDDRAGATFDFQLDEADRGNKRIACQVLALWGSRGALHNWYDVLAIWRDWADDVRGRAIESGHFIPEEASQDTYTELRAFFTS